MLDNLLFSLSTHYYKYSDGRNTDLLGNHILTRGIIFIDIAVAQVAALGTMIDYYSDLPKNPEMYSLSHMHLQSS
jgi:hypothetical protein